MFKLTINIVILFLTAWNCICVFRVFRVLKAVINVWGCYYYWQASPQSQVLHRFCVCGFLLVVFLCLFFVSFISQRTLFFLLTYISKKNYKLTKLPLFNKFLLLWVLIVAHLRLTTRAGHRGAEHSTTGRSTPALSVQTPVSPPACF